MNIILVSNNSAKAKTLTLTSTHLMLLATGFLFSSMLMAMGLNYVSLRYAHQIDNPILRPLVTNIQQEEHQKAQLYLRDSLNAMAVRMGQMQAQLLRLDSVGARLAELSGIKSQEFMFNQVPGQGGAVTTLASKDVSFMEVSNKIQEMSRILDDRADKLDALDSMLMQDRLKKKMLPSVMPIASRWYSSGFGIRSDPFTGRSVFH